MAKNILVAYYSHSANTKKIAEMIQQKTGGDIFEIQPEIPYPADYNTVTVQAKKEIKAGFRPVLKSGVPHIEAYDTVFVGSPNWWSTIAPPVAAFLQERDFSGKTIVSFCTHGGGGIGHIEKDIAKLCPQSTMLTGFSVYGNGDGNTKAQIDQWLRKINMVVI